MLVAAEVTTEKPVQVTPKFPCCEVPMPISAKLTDGFSKGKIDEVFWFVALRRALFLLLEVILASAAVLQCR